MPIDIENKTHWRTSDVTRIVRSALAEAGVAEDERVAVWVEWCKGPVAKVFHIFNKKHTLTIGLPRRGPTVPHSNPMLSVALSAVDTPKDAALLAFSETFRLANNIAYIVADARRFVSGVASAERADRLALAASKPDQQPTWAPVETFMVQKYKDPKKDGTYIDFVLSKERKIAFLDKQIEKADAMVAEWQAKRKRFALKKAAAEKSLRLARERRS